ncbi:MAG: hypothetical protein H6726_22405 [Sandaracinaceae bacterium]|nr:hypothetical protein [Myxococcales bacterium]MCB9660413.1 hypothetical protein [Sandaracinaceae bacterium]
MGYEYVCNARLSTGESRELATALERLGYIQLANMDPRRIRLRLGDAAPREGWDEDFEVIVEDAVTVVAHGGTGRDRARLLRAVASFLAGLGYDGEFTEA